MDLQFIAIIDRVIAIHATVNYILRLLLLVYFYFSIVIFKSTI